jgi:putative Ca2+/H+ antiporter (TMEM165/GDT1 family)
MDWKLLMTTFGTLFLAELGDKTQLACVMLAAKTEKPWTVFLGSSLALVAVSFLGVVFAQLICQYVPADVIKKVAAGGFVVLGLLMLMDKL